MAANKPAGVLIVEDDALLNEGTARQLTRMGYALSGCAYDGPRAIEMAMERHPSVVLMDLQMIDPETGREDMQAGMKAARTIRERCPTPVVALSAHESQDVIRQAGEAGMIGYLVKPARDTDLFRAICIAEARFAELQQLRELTEALSHRNAELQAALAKVKVLSQLLRACAGCRKIQDEQGQWHQMESYLTEHSDLTFSHGLCPECSHSLYPDIFPIQPGR
jgi:two-component system, response regulator PdtaR